jgi:catechol 2,3-dioxygenase-like lactoylglutathione lyase family enzyme
MKSGRVPLNRTSGERDANQPQVRDQAELSVASATRTLNSGEAEWFGITHLRHVDLAVPDYETQRSFYKDLWGLSEVGTDGKLSYLAAEGSPEQYIVRLRHDDEKRLDLLSFGMASDAAVDALAHRLGTASIQLVSTPDELQTAGGGYGFRFFDVDGRTVEVSSGVETRRYRRIEEGESIPVKLSHTVVNSADPNRTRDFYVNVLGFKLTDTLWGEHMGEMMHFLRCNDWHHSLAVARGPHTALHHVSFELRGLDEYMRGTGRLMRAGVRKIWGPGRHNAGNNTFSYFLDPSGNTMEYTTELAVIDTDQWHPHIYDIADPNTQDLWGTADPMSEIIARDSFNEPDRGVFVPPPV